MRNATDLWEEVARAGAYVLVRYTLAAEDWIVSTALDGTTYHVYALPWDVTQPEASAALWSGQTLEYGQAKLARLAVTVLDEPSVF